MFLYGTNMIKKFYSLYYVHLHAKKPSTYLLVEVVFEYKFIRIVLYFTRELVNFLRKFLPFLALSPSL